MSVAFTIDQHSTIPIFRQIAEGLLGEIARGVYRAGDLLPSVRALAETLGVNPNTVHRAIGELERDGWVAAERGRGMVVLEGIGHSARLSGADTVLARLTEAMRHARAIGLDEEQIESLISRAQNQIGWPGRDRGSQ